MSELEAVLSGKAKTTKSLNELLSGEQQKRDTAYVVGTIRNTEKEYPKYMDHLLNLRTDKLGASYDNMDKNQLREYLINARWEEEKELSSGPYRVFRTNEIPGGRGGYVGVDHLPDDVEITAYDSDKSGEGWFSVDGQVRGEPEKYTYIVLEEVEEDQPIVANFHPDAPKHEETKNLDELGLKAGDKISKAQAQSIGLSGVRIEGVLGALYQLEAVIDKALQELKKVKEFFPLNKDDPVIKISSKEIKATELTEDEMIIVGDIEKKTAQEQDNADKDENNKEATASVGQALPDANMKLHRNKLRFEFPSGHVYEAEIKTKGRGDNLKILTNDKELQKIVKAVFNRENGHGYTTAKEIKTKQKDRKKEQGLDR